MVHVTKVRGSQRKLRSTGIFVFISACVVAILFAWNKLMTISGDMSNSAARAKTMVATSSSEKLFCDGDTPCVFDIGHNTGQDTARYLKDTARQVKVVAVDANPVLMNASRTRFSKEAAQGRLILVAAGLVGVGSQEGPLQFWVNRKVDKFSSFKERSGCRDSFGKYLEPTDDQAVIEKRRREICYSTLVPTRTCASLIQEFGVPSYAKIDIEGLDYTCVESIATLPVNQRPKYISVENVFPSSVDLLVSAGYGLFKAVNQLEHGYKYLKSPKERGHSGPWGENALDYLTGTKWVDVEEMRNRLPLPTNGSYGGKTFRIWFDLHGKLQ